MKQYIVDAFTSKPFSGNPAAVCVMDRPLPDESMRNLAMENNLAQPSSSRNVTDDTPSLQRPPSGRAPTTRL